MTASHRKTLLTVALALAVLGLVLSTIVTPSRRPSGAIALKRGRVPHALKRGRVPQALVAQAKPLWNGDTFKIDPTGTARGGSGSLPPYQWSSAWEEGRGFLPHSNTDPNVMGVTMQPDPAGLARRVIKIRADERQTNGLYTRVELRGPDLFSAGMTDWVISEVYIPPGTPTMPTATDWWTIMEVYGAPYGGPGPMTVGLSRNPGGTGNDFVWSEAGGIRWRSVATTGVWYIIARKIHFATDATGYVEIYKSQRDAAGHPTGPLQSQRLTNGQTRWNFATLASANNEGINHPDVKNYHIANMWPGRAYTDLYFARQRVYDGSVPVKEIDPYYTGLK